jgi:hypothetical protein
LGWVDLGHLDCDHLAVVDLVPGPGGRLAGKGHRALRGEGCGCDQREYRRVAGPQREELLVELLATRYQVAVDDRAVLDVRLPMAPRLTFSPVISCFAADTASSASP